MIEDLLLGMLFGACGSLVLWVTVGRSMMLRYAGKSVINAFREPSPELSEAIRSLSGMIWEWLNSDNITVEVLGEDKKPIKTKISPMQQVLATLIQEIVDRTMKSLRGTQAVVARESNALMQGMGIPLPRKGQSTQEFLMEQIAIRLAPVIEKKIGQMINNTDGTITNQGGY